MRRIKNENMRMVLRGLTVIAVLLLLMAATVWSLGKSNDSSTVRTIRIALVVDGPCDLNAVIFGQLQTVLKEVLGNRINVVFTDGGPIAGDWTLHGVSKINSSILSDPNVDLVLGLGVIASHDLATRGTLPKPVIAPIVVDPARQNVPLTTRGTSGVKNLSYLVFPITLKEDVPMFRKIVPFKKMVCVMSKRYVTALPPAPISVQEIGRQLGIELLPLEIDTVASDLLNAIPADAEAVYCEPSLHLPRAEFHKLIRGFIERKLPSFSLLGESDVREGIMAGANPDVFPRLVRRIALNLQRILQGEEPGTLSVTFPAARRLFFNFRTGYQVMAVPNWDVLLESDLAQVETASPFAEHYTLQSVMKRVSESNLDLQALTQGVQADAENVAMARANLFPRLDVTATGYQIDADRAQAGYQPERTASAELGITQAIFSEPALANLSIQSSLYDGRVSELEQARLNTIVAGASAYANCLRANRLFDILLENLKNTRSNLQMAEVRRSTGAAGEEESLRWQAEIAEMKKAVLTLNAQMNQARYLLNQHLNLPLNQELDLADVSLQDSTMFIANEKVAGYLGNPIAFDILTEYMVSEGLKRSPELAQLDATIAAQERSLGSARLSYFVPSIGAFARLSNNFYKSDQPIMFQTGSIPAPPEGLDPRIPQYLGQLFSSVMPALPDRNDWTVGLQLSLNLFNGFSTQASEAKASRQLEQYKSQRASAQEKIALRIRSDMQSAKASYFAIAQSHAEQAAAHRALQLVTDAYSRGAVSILSVLDAQNSSLRADQVSTNALYDFVIQYMQLQRSLGQFDLLMTPDERTEFLSTIIERMENSLRRNP